MKRPHDFRPAPWLPGPHLQTLWAGILRRWPRVETRRERIELPDGDYIDLDWAESEGTGPIVIIIHGLEGSLRSRYAAGIMRILARQGLRPVLMNLRGCSGEPNRLPRRYHSGETGDLAHLVELLRQRHPGLPIAAIGYSLGGNMLLKWLGESGNHNPLAAAVAVSVPFELGRSSRRLGQGLSRIYERVFLHSLKRSIQEKLDRFPLPLTAGQLRAIETLWQFDDLVTAPLHGFRDAPDYYTHSSSRQFLNRIEVPTLVLQAEDDPFLPPDAIPAVDELSPTVQMELSPHGGHVGFVAGPPWAPRYWLEQRIPRWLREHLPRNVAQKKGP